MSIAFALRCAPRPACVQEAAGLQATFIGHPVLDELMWDAQSASWEVPRTAETEAARAAALAEIAKEVAARTGRRTGDPSAAVAPAVRRREGFLGESAEASCAGEMGSNPPQEGDVARNQSADSAGPSGRPWPVVCVLPGSRPQEIRRLLPLFGAVTLSLSPLLLRRIGSDRIVFSRSDQSCAPPQPPSLL